MLIVRITILIPALVIALVAVILIIIADELFTREIRYIIYIKNEIKHSVAYIKKASHSALEKIKAEYERKQLQETNEYLSETLMEKLSEFMQGVNMIDDAKSMEEELLHNRMVKRDLKNMLGYVTPYIPLIGLVCGISIVGKHMYNRKTNPTEENVETRQQ